jgi:hypothetical protein
MLFYFSCLLMNIGKQLIPYVKFERLNKGLMADIVLMDLNMCSKILFHGFDFDFCYQNETHINLIVIFII